MSPLAYQIDQICAPADDLQGVAMCVQNGGSECVKRAVPGWRFSGAPSTPQRLLGRSLQRFRTPTQLRSDLLQQKPGKMADGGPLPRSAAIRPDLTITLALLATLGGRALCHTGTPDKFRRMRR